MGLLGRLLLLDLGEDVEGADELAEFFAAANLLQSVILGVLVDP